MHAAWTGIDWMKAIKSRIIETPYETENNNMIKQGHGISFIDAMLINFDLRARWSLQEKMANRVRSNSNGGN